MDPPGFHPISILHLSPWPSQLVQDKHSTQVRVVLGGQEDYIYEFYLSFEDAFEGSLFSAEFIPGNMQAQKLLETNPKVIEPMNGKRGFTDFI